MLNPFISLPFLIGSLLAWLLSGSPAFAAGETQSLDFVKQTAQEYLISQLDPSFREKITIHTGELDSRLRLTVCHQALQAFIPFNSSPLQARSVGVRCEGEEGWAIYVPVRVTQLEHVITLTRPLGLGEIIRAEDLTVLERDVQHQAGGFINDPLMAIGMVARTPLSAGAVLTPRDIVPPMVVHKGEPVTILARIKGLTVTMQGIALENAAKGQLMEVRNVGSGRTVRGQASGPHEVLVSLP